MNDYNYIKLQQIITKRSHFKTALKSSVTIAIVVNCTNA